MFIPPEFNQSKYTKWYFHIIAKASAEERSKSGSVYLEAHHIIPSSIRPHISRGSAHSWNVVLLTPREHFLCHYMLCKMTSGVNKSKMVRAFTFMYTKNKHQKRYFNSRLYELARRSIGQIMSDSQTGAGNSQAGSLWVCRESDRTNVKIQPSEVDKYIADGYSRGRVVDWDARESKRVSKIQNEISKIHADLDDIVSQIQDLQDRREQMLATVSRLELEI